MAADFAQWSPYNYVLGNPISLVDPDGRAPEVFPIIPLVIWGAIEVGLAIYDGYDVYTTVTDENATLSNKLTSISGAAAGLFLPGGGYSAADDIVEGASKYGDEVADIVRGGGKGKGGSGSSGGADIPDDTPVVRGGTCKCEQFENGSGVTVGKDGKLDGVSVNSKSSKSVKELSQGIRNGQVGVTTVGDVRKAGGNVVPSPNNNNPNHATMSGVTGKTAEKLFNPTIKNPSKNK